MGLLIVGIVILVIVAACWPNGGGAPEQSERPKQRMAWGHPIGDPDGHMTQEEYERKRAALKQQLHDLDEDMYNPY